MNSLVGKYLITIKIRRNHYWTKSLNSYQIRLELVTKQIATGQKRLVISHPKQKWKTLMDTHNILMKQGNVGHHPSPGAVGSTPLAFKSQAHPDPVNLPERPDQPECQHYIKTGNCKYGSNCKYHHPKGRSSVATATTLGPLGLPLRPGQPACSFYSLHGTCNYGPACKFDHPLFGYYNYAVPAIPYPDLLSLVPAESGSLGSTPRATKPKTGRKAPSPDGMKEQRNLAVKTLPKVRTKQAEPSTEDHHD